MQVPVRGNFLRPVGTYSDHLYTALIELSAQFFQSTQLADTVGSPVGPEELEEHENKSRKRRGIRLRDTSSDSDDGLN